MAVTTSNTNKPILPRGADVRPIDSYNRASLYSGKALSFDGVNDKVDITASAFDLYTLSFYFKGVIDTGTNGFVFHTDSQTNNGVAIGHVTSTLTAETIIMGNNGIYTAIAENFADGIHFVTITWNATANKYDFYVNGQEVATFNNGSDAPLHLNVTNPKLGYRPSFNDFYLDGGLSNVRAFNTALTAAQVADLYNNPEKVVPTGVTNSALKLWLPMMEGAGTTTYDGSGNGNHGTINGATWQHGIGAPVAQTAVIDWNKGTNLLTYSERFGQWTQNDSSVSDNVESAPNGTTTADKWVIDSGENSTANIRKNITSQVGKDYLLYVFVKADEFNLFQLDTSNAQFSDVNVNFNLSTGSIISSGGDNITEGIIDKGNGWYLCYMVGTAISTSGSFIIRNWASQTGDGSKGMYLWGGGYVQASDIAPYIPTIDATPQTSPVLLPQGLTTGRDITGVNLFENVRKQGALNLDGNSWAEVHDNESLDFGTGSFTLEAWVKAKYFFQGSVFNMVISLGGNITSSNNAGLMLLNNNVPYFIYSNPGASSGSAQNEGDWLHIVGTYDETNTTIYVNGAQVDQDVRTAADITNEFAKFIGRDGTDPNRYYHSQIAQPRIYNRGLTASEVLNNYNVTKDLYI